MVRAGDIIRASDVAVQACRVTRSSALSIPDGGAVTTVGFDAEVFDTDGMHSTVTNNSRITIQTAGFYTVGFNGTLATDAAYVRSFCEVVLNGSTSLGRSQTPGVSSQQTLSISTVYQFDVGDYVELQVFQDSTAAHNLEVTADRSPEFWAARIGS